MCFAIYYLIISEKLLCISLWVYFFIIISFLILLYTSIKKTEQNTWIICHSKFVVARQPSILEARFVVSRVRIRKMRFTLDLCSSFLITVFLKPLRKLARFPFRVPLMYCSSRGGTERCIVKPEMGNAGHCCLGTFVQNVMRYRLTK